uniref:translation initiation factor IF-2-like n=1 Tax=Agelaius phoeniceus TaxID=39638 RepID=UPI0023ED5F2A
PSPLSPGSVVAALSPLCVCCGSLRLHPELEKFWAQEIPKAAAAPAREFREFPGQEQWEERLLQFLQESLESITEKSWICALVTETSRQLRAPDGSQEKLFLFRCLGAALGPCPSRALIRDQLPGAAGKRPVPGGGRQGGPLVLLWDLCPEPPGGNLGKIGGIWEIRGLEEIPGVVQHLQGPQRGGAGEAAGGARALLRPRGGGGAPGAAAIAPGTAAAAAPPAARPQQGPGAEAEPGPQRLHDRPSPGLRQCREEFREFRELPRERPRRLRQHRPQGRAGGAHGGIPEGGASGGAADAAAAASAERLRTPGGPGAAPERLRALRAPGHGPGLRPGPAPAGIRETPGASRSP